MEYITLAEASSNKLPAASNFNVESIAIHECYIYNDCGLFIERAVREESRDKFRFFLKNEADRAIGGILTFSQRAPKILETG